MEFNIYYENILEILILWFFLKKKKKRRYDGSCFAILIFCIANEISIIIVAKCPIKLCYFYIKNKNEFIISLHDLTEKSVLSFNMNRDFLLES